MIIQHRYSTILKRFFTLCFCFVAGIFWVSAQITPSSPEYIEVCKNKSESANFAVTPVGSLSEYVFEWFIFRGSDWERLSIPNRPTYNAVETGEYKCVARKTATGEEFEPVFFKAVVNDVPFVSDIDAPSICEGGDLTATVNTIIFHNNLKSLPYEWKLSGTTIEKGTIEPGDPLELIIRQVPVSQSTSVLSLTVGDDVNSCGTTTTANWIYVRPNPKAPVFDQTEKYCHEQKLVLKDSLKIIERNRAWWYQDSEGKIPVLDNETKKPIAPVPETSKTGDQSWWVLQEQVWPQSDPDYGLVCKSSLTEAKITVLPLSDSPLIPEHIISKCLYDQEFTPEAEGDNLKWYRDIGQGQTQPLNVAPQINTSLATNQIYFVTQTKPNECESPKDDNGKITILIRDRAKTEEIKLTFDPPYATQLCPNNSIRIEATPSNSQITNPVFKWYAYSNKTGDIEGEPIPQGGSAISTPPLMKDTVFYVTIRYNIADVEFCESNYPRPAIVNVGDIELPYFTIKGSQNQDSTVRILPQLEFFTDEISCKVPYNNFLPTVRDNCTDQENLKPFTKSPLPEYFLLGDTTITWWVKDDAGNEDYALQSVRVRDIIPPQGKCPEDMVWLIDESEESAFVSYNLENLYTDNCGKLKFDRKILFAEIGGKKDSVLITPEWGGIEDGLEFPFGTTRVIHEIFDKSGNITTCSFNVIVKYPPRPLTVYINSTSGNTICLGQEVVITSAVSGGSGRYVYSWEPRPWSEPIFKDYPERDVTYTLIVSDGETSLSKTVDIKVLKPDGVKLVLDGGVQMDRIFEGDEVLVTATRLNSDKYFFSSYKLLLNNEVIQEIGLNNQVSFQAELGTYFIRVFAKDENFCVAEDQMLIEVDSRKLPNAFTPNSRDGKNRLFLEGFDLEVYTRSNELLYKGFDGWDGYHKGKLLPQGTYLYVVRRIMNNGQLWIFKGTVTLKQ